MPQALPLKEFLVQPGPLLDVRSPSEYLQGHIPRSHSFPLFSDGERAQIGTVYKKQGRAEAVELGLFLVRPKLDTLLNQATALLGSTGKVLCWRGGMRSGFTARLFELLGYAIQTLQGGYKVYRRSVLQQLSVAPQRLCVLGGLTGSGKTAVLKALRQLGEQVIDLEALANHRGSAFGGIGMVPQPTQEQFENELALQFEQIDWTKPVWVEDESRLIGRCHLPSALYHEMHQAPLFFLQCSLGVRIQTLLDHYGGADTAQLVHATLRIAKRLGSQLTREILQLFEEEKRELAFEKLLIYYDKTYQHQLFKRPIIHRLGEKEGTSPDNWARALQHFYKQYV